MPGKRDREPVAFLTRLENKDRRVRDQIQRLTRLRNILHGELTRLRAGEHPGVVEARLARYMVRV